MAVQRYSHVVVLKITDMYTISSCLPLLHTHTQGLILYVRRKICLELLKRMNSDLPYTRSHHQFYEGEMPSFSEMPEKPKKPKHAPRRGLMGDIGRWLSMLV